MHIATLISDLELAAPAVRAWMAGFWDAFARTAGTTLATAIWQGAVIVCGLEICTRLMPRISAAQRFAVWAAGFAMAIGLPVLPLLHFGAGGAMASGAEFAGAADSGGALLRLDARWGVAIAALWVVAAAIRGADLLVHSIRLRRLWKAARRVEVSKTISGSLKDVRGGRVAICTTEMLDRPSVIGFWSPRILIPEWLIAKLTPGELEQIVLHEAEHLRRRDDWTNLAQKLAMVVFPLNPALAWMEHRLCREREMACDEGVVRITNAPRAYAACLTSLAERGLERRAEALSLGAWHKRSELVHRVHGILLRKHGLNRAAAGALLGTVGCALLGGSVEMARCPQVVAFVPEQKTMAMTRERQQQLSELLAHENAEANMALPTGYEAVQARAVVPSRPLNVNRAAHKNAAQVVKAGPRANGAGQSDSRAEQVATADVLGDRVNAGDVQQWVVLTTWEEVQSVSRPSSTTSVDAVSDYDAVATNAAPAARAQNKGTADGQGSSKSQNQASRQYAVTQLILRVVPADPNSNSTQPATGMVRGGWFVIQL